MAFKYSFVHILFYILHSLSIFFTIQALVTSIYFWCETTIGAPAGKADLYEMTANGVSAQRKINNNIQFVINDNNLNIK